MTPTTRGSVVGARQVIIVGAGGFGREVLDILEAMGNTGHQCVAVGFLDDGTVDVDRLSRRGVGLLGRTCDLPRHSGEYVVAIGNGQVRHALVGRLIGLPTAAPLIHPSAAVARDVRLGMGVVVAAGASLAAAVRVGDHVHVNLNVAVASAARVDDFATLFPGATVGRGAVVGCGATIGSGANILSGVTIGEWAYVGAGAVVTEDVPVCTVVVGLPARPLRRND